MYASLAIARACSALTSAFGVDDESVLLHPDSDAIKSRTTTTTSFRTASSNIRRDPT